VQTIYLHFFVFANNFFKNFPSPPSKKIMVRPLTTACKQATDQGVVKIVAGSTLSLVSGNFMARKSAMFLATLFYAD
jgi:hypothetical protein